MSFDQFIARCLRREPEAWEELIATHREPVLRVLGRLLGSADPSSIQDLEQKTYERLLDPKVLQSIEGPQHLRAWVCRTAANLAKDRRRRMRVRQAQTFHEESASGVGDFQHAPNGPEAAFLRKQKVERLLAILEQLVSGPNAERDKLIFHSYYFDDLGAGEIAALDVGLTPKGVETVIFRLTKRLREQVLQEGEPAA